MVMSVKEVEIVPSKNKPEIKGSDYGKEIGEKKAAKKPKKHYKPLRKRVNH